MHQTQFSEKIPYGGGFSQIRSHIAKPRPNKAQKRPRDDIGQENVCAGSGGSQPPSKRGRKSKLDSEHRCGECTVWLQTGGNKDLQKYHKQESNMHHPFEKLIANFLSCNGLS